MSRPSCRSPTPGSNDRRPRQRPARQASFRRSRALSRDPDARVAFAALRERSRRDWFGCQAVVEGDSPFRGLPAAAPFRSTGFFPNSRPATICWRGHKMPCFIGEALDGCAPRWICRRSNKIRSPRSVCTRTTAAVVMARGCCRRYHARSWRVAKIRSCTCFQQRLGHRAVPPPRHGNPPPAACHGVAEGHVRGSESRAG